MPHRIRPTVLALCGVFLCMSHTAFAWEHHPLFTKPVLSTMQGVSTAAPASATSLEAFLMAVEADLVTLLNDEETWARTNMPAYKPRPDALAFQATGNPSDIRDRFFKAIRVNPTIKTPLYISPLAGAKANPKASLSPSEVSILADTSNLAIFDFEALSDGDLASPIDIVTASSNEPDYGMDIGLFEDNNTDFGLYYGFGVQPFGNPGLDFGSQAPFHMGFYDESPIIYFFASFLEESYPQYRIHLFKSLSEFAFHHGQDYWGWRFMGWGLHYLGDLSMPYHTTALPGYSALRMLWVNILDMIGWSAPKDNAVQLSSNRHVALETFQGVILADAVRNDNAQDLTLATLLAGRTIPAYSDSVPADLLAGQSHALSRELDGMIAKYMPQYYVNNPSVELGDIEERHEIVDMIIAEHGPEAVEELEKLQAEAMSSFACYGRSFVLAVLGSDK